MGLVSWGKRFLIKTLVLNGADINYGKTSSNCNASSNVSALMSALSGKKKKKGRCQKVKLMFFSPCQRHDRSNSREKQKKEEKEKDDTSRKNELPVSWDWL